MSGQDSTVPSSQPLSLLSKVTGDPQAAGSSLPFPSESLEVPWNPHTPGHPLNWWLTHTPSFLPLMVAILWCDLCCLWTYPLELNHGAFYAMDTCLMSPSCLVSLPCEYCVPIQILFPIPQKCFIIIHFAPGSIVFSGEINTRELALWPLGILFSLSKPQFLHL